MLDRKKSVLITGATGMVGAAVQGLFARDGFENILVPSHQDLDLENQNLVLEYFERYRPKHVLMIASRVGGIAANQADPVGFLTANARIAVNLFEASFRYAAEKNLFLGSSCIYPRDCQQPMREEYLLTGPLEPTNEGYALAKIMGLRLAQYYHRQHGMNTVSVMPCNIYGTGDSFDLEKSHVLSALVRRFVDAQDAGLPQVTLWGTGAARREFIHVDDVANALLFFMDHYDSPEILNLGTGTDATIRELAHMIAKEAGFSGTINWDSSRPDGMPRKCLDVSRMKQLGFIPKIDLEAGIRRTVLEYRKLKREKQIE